MKLLRKLFGDPFWPIVAPLIAVVLLALLLIVLGFKDRAQGQTPKQVSVWTNMEISGDTLLVHPTDIVRSSWSNLIRIHWEITNRVIEAEIITNITPEDMPFPKAPGKHYQDLSVKWLGSPITGEKFGGGPADGLRDTKQEADIIIGLREDGVVVWRNR